MRAAGQNGRSVPIAWPLRASHRGVREERRRTRRCEQVAAPSRHALTKRFYAAFDQCMRAARRRRGAAGTTCLGAERALARSVEQCARGLPAGHHLAEPTAADGAAIHHDVGRRDVLHVRHRTTNMHRKRVVEIFERHRFQAGTARGAASVVHQHVDAPVPTVRAASASTAASASMNVAPVACATSAPSSARRPTSGASPRWRARRRDHPSERGASGGNRTHI